MKKFLVVLMILAVAGGLFAQGLVIGGELRAGVSVVDDGVVAGGGAGDSNRLHVSGTYALDDFGAKFNIRFDKPGFAAPVLSNGYAWVDMFGDMANVKVGLIDDGVWKTGGDKDFGLATGVGLRLEVTPLEGLNFGVFIPGDISTNESFDKKNEINIGDTFSELVIGASYSNDMFAVGAGFDIGGRANGDTIIGEVDTAFTAALGVSLKMVENLSATIEAYLYGASKNVPIAFDDDGFGVWLTQKAEYAIADNFRAGLVAHEQFFTDFDSKLMFKLYGSYDINALITAALDVTLDDVWLDGPDFGDDATDPKLVLKPKATFKVGDGASIDVSDEVTIPFAEGADLGNKFAIEFVYSF